ncbi:gag-protease polyprotein [Cucumis melo var. makuwa]|uniref:Gag-protease polyprotein n=1 Tax=Cucumis melo var. makuwa TaxID=1194695 RepID=A0A5A7SJM7_CUCMM|nr:gag-protease polyprotein [Cucumis melo var. makuwa]
MEQRYQDMLQVEAKYLRDFRKYNPKTFDEFMDNPTKAQMWLTSIEKILRYMKCPEDQKVRCAVFFLEDRGTAWWKTAEKMLGGDVSKINQGELLCYVLFCQRKVREAVKVPELGTRRHDCGAFVRGLRLDLQGIVRALRPTTHADALRLTLDLSLHERADSSKVAGRGLVLEQKRKVELQPDLTP